MDVRMGIIASRERVLVILIAAWVRTYRLTLARRSLRDQFD